MYILKKWKYKLLSRVWLFATLWTIQSMEFSRPEFSSPRDLPNPAFIPRSPALQADSLPAEPQRKPKSTGVGSLSLLQWVFLTKELNQGILPCPRSISRSGRPTEEGIAQSRTRLKWLSSSIILHCWQILYQLSYQGSPYFKEMAYFGVIIKYMFKYMFKYIYSVQFSCSVVSDPLRPHGLQHARLPCPSPTPGAYSNLCPLSWWCHPIIPSSVAPFSSCLQSFWNSPSQNTGVVSLSFLQQIFPTQGSNPGLLHCRKILYQLSQKGSPIYLLNITYYSKMDMYFKQFFYPWTS